MVFLFCFICVYLRLSAANKKIDGEWQNFALINNPNRTHNLFGIQVEFSGDGKTLAIASANSARDKVFSDASIHIYKKRKKSWAHEHSIANADFYDFSEIDPTSPIKFALSYSGNKIAIAQKNKIAIFVPNVNKQKKRKRKRRRKRKRTLELTSKQPSLSAFRPVSVGVVHKLLPACVPQ